MKWKTGNFHLLSMHLHCFPFLRVKAGQLEPQPLSILGQTPSCRNPVQEEEILKCKLSKRFLMTTYSVVTQKAGVYSIRISGEGSSTERLLSSRQSVKSSHPRFVVLSMSWPARSMGRILRLAFTSANNPATVQLNKCSLECPDLPSLPRVPSVCLGQTNLPQFTVKESQRGSCCCRSENPGICSQKL